ncbi:MAG TPA: F420-nonreducing hydrogenase, partial [Acidothermaceae bacterium]|nr:F420-nonreducing hydrogenase [Acidothermaceae bacterium]
MSRPTLATIWLDGCSGCHMSFLDMDERLLEVAARADLVYSPLVDTKVYPESVDIVLVEGAVSTDEDMERVRLVRSRTKILVALGDCAVTT